MSISLKKGGSISLSKESGLSKVFMGLGWDAAKPAKPAGFLGRLVGGGGQPADIDLDASVIVFDADGRVLDTVWFRQLKSKDGSINHSGDNRTGDGDGDDETISVDLGRLPSAAETLIFTVNSFTGQNFNEVDNAVCRLVDTRGNEELCQFEKGAHTGVIMASLSRKSGDWKMTAIGEVMNGRTVTDMAAEAVRFL